MSSKSIVMALALFITGWACGSVGAETAALLHARIIDGTGVAPRENGTILIENGVIVAVGGDSDVKVPEGAKTTDLTGKSVLPGLISVHSHIGQTDGAKSGPENYNRANIVRELKQWQRYGVTTVTSLGLNAPLFYQLQPLAHRGTLGGADFFGADRGIGAPAPGAPPVNVGTDQLYRPRTAEEARRDVDETARRHPSLVKVWVDDFRHSLPGKMSPEIYRAVIDESHRQGLRVAAHVYYLEDAKRLASEGVDIFAHGIRDRKIDDELVTAMKARGTWYVPTLGLDESFYIYAKRPAWMDTPYFRAAIQPSLAKMFDDAAWRAKALDPASLAANEASLKINQANLLTLYKAGVKIGFGTDSGATPLRIPGIAEHRELALMVQAGLTPLQAITVATRDSAHLLQLTDRGVIAPGKRADLVVVDGNPALRIEDIARVDAVWQQGMQVSGPISGE